MREKEKATARQVQQSPETVTCCSGEVWGFYGYFNSELGGFFSLAVDSWAFSGELVCLPLYCGRGNKLGSILLVSPMADLSDLISLL
jgi:hypothetical protein